MKCLIMKGQMILTIKYPQSYKLRAFDPLKSKINMLSLLEITNIHVSAKDQC